MLWHRLYEHPNLGDVDFDESYVLGWRLEASSLVLDVDAVLLPAHADHRPPAPNEWASFRRCSLTFTDVRDLSGYDALDATRPARDSSGEADYGHIDDAFYTRLGEYRLRIECAGSLSFSAGGVNLAASPV